MINRIKIFQKKKRIAVIFVIIILWPLLSFSDIIPAYQREEKCRKCHQNPKIFETGNGCKNCHKEENNPDTLRGIEKIEFKTASKSFSTDMALVPAGEFWMGNNGRRSGEGTGDPDETPMHKVFVRSFLIDVYEVTNTDYKKFVDATGYPEPYHWKKGKIPPNKEKHPVVYVNWKDANNYCKWAGKRLPTEAEWEKAARGPDGKFYPWGEEFDAFKANTPQRWLILKTKGDTMPVGSFKDGKSPYGLYDMSGNVWEWTASWYERYPGNKYPKTSYGKMYKVLKGGSWYNCLSYGCGLSAVASNRSEISPTIKNSSFGFRCAMTP